LLSLCDWHNSLNYNRVWCTKIEIL
jgi:hypothetical protein